MSILTEKIERLCMRCGSKFDAIVFEGMKLNPITPDMVDSRYIPEFKIEATVNLCGTCQKNLSY